MKLREPEWKATLEQYTLYTDIIIAQQSQAECQCSQVRGDQDQVEPGGVRAISGEQGNWGQTGGPNMGEAKQLLWGLHKELLHKRQLNSSSESSDSGSNLQPGEAGVQQEVMSLPIPVTMVHNRGHGQS